MKSRSTTSGEIGDGGQWPLAGPALGSAATDQWQSSVSRPPRQTAPRENNPKKTAPESKKRAERDGGEATLPDRVIDVVEQQVDQVPGHVPHPRDSSPDAADAADKAPFCVSMASLIARARLSTRA